MINNQLLISIIQNFQLEYVLRIALAAFFGGLVGYERKNRLKKAGVRTHLIVCLGAALMMLISKYGFADLANQPGYRMDPSRVASQIVTGIGFLGAGVIFVRKQTVSGLTTAAGIWTTAGIGMAFGAGMYILAAVSTLILILMQVLLRSHPQLFFIPVAESFEILVKNTPEAVKDLRRVLEEQKITIFNVRVDKLDNSVTQIDLLVKFPPSLSVDALMELLNNLDYVVSFEF